MAGIGCGVEVVAVWDGGGGMRSRGLFRWGVSCEPVGLRR